MEIFLTIALKLVTRTLGSNFTSNHLHVALQGILEHKGKNNLLKA